jgi:hypothetical protein
MEPVRKSGSNQQQNYGIFLVLNFQRGKYFYYTPSLFCTCKYFNCNKSNSTIILRSIIVPLPPGKTRYPLCRRLGGPRVGLDVCEKSRHNRDSIPGPSARSHSLYRLSYTAHHIYGNSTNLGEGGIS